VHTKWDNLRQNIEVIVKELNIPREDFQPLGIYDDWEQIEQKIYDKFCDVNYPNNKPVWLWEHFKLKTTSLPLEARFNLLEKLVEPKEDVWFFVNGDKDKFWFYHGNIGAILKVILESSYIDELYLASKKYEWLICINHHDVLVATGEPMAERLLNLSNEVSML